jgi:hypothetical protein
MLVGLFPAEALAEENAEPGIALEAGAWQVALSGSITWNNQSVSFRDDLGFNTTTPWYASISCRAGKQHNRFKISYFTLSTSSTVSSGRAYTYSGAVVNVGNTITSDVRLSELEGVYSWNLSHNEKARLDLLIGLRHVDFYSTFRNSASNQTVTQAGSTFLPELGLGCDFSLGQGWRGLAEVKWIDGGTGSGRASFFDYSAGLTTRIADHLDLNATYSGQRIFARDSVNNSAELVLNGPRFTLQYRF